MNGLSIPTLCGQWSQRDYSQPPAANRSSGFMTSTGRKTVIIMVKDKQLPILTIHREHNILQ